MNVVPDSPADSAGDIGKPLKTGDTMIDKIADGKRKGSTGGEFNQNLGLLRFVVVKFGEVEIFFGFIFLTLGVGMLEVDGDGRGIDNFN